MVKKVFFSAVIIFFLFSALLPAVAITANAEEMPVFYLRGSFGTPAWGYSDEYKFVRNGNEYSIHVDYLDGAFKISNEDWSINYGGLDQIQIDGECVVTGIHNGLNYKASSLQDIEIKFTYDGSKQTEISFTSGGGIIVADKHSGTLPILYINVYDSNGGYNNEITDYNLDHKNYFDGSYWLDLNGCEWLEALGAESIGDSENPLPLQIKARGNWTRTGYSKKPFKLKLGSKQKLLGMSKSKHYAILAHADDNYSYLRNFTGFNLGRRIGLPWTPSQQPVEVYINGDYRGLYFLTESIRVETDRVDIQELLDNETNSELISGGYLVELDNYDEETGQIRMEEATCTPWQHTDMLRITFDTPEEYSELMARFVKDQFTAMNEFIGSNNDEIWSYMDLDDAARYYLVEEIISHVEAYHGSTYLFRDYGEGMKWHFTPLWDCGNAFNGRTDAYFYDCDPYGNTWISSMRENAVFNAKVRETWLWFMSNEFDGLYKDMEDYAARIEAAAKADHRRWDGEPVPHGGLAVSNNSDIGKGLRSAKSKLEEKIEWLKTKKDFGDFTSGVYPEPERDMTPAAPLPAYAQSGVDVVEIPTEGNVIYYNLQGIRVDNPEKGMPYIKVTERKSEKVIY